MTTSISSKRKLGLINELVLCHMLRPEDFRKFSFWFLPSSEDTKIANAKTESSVEWNGMYYLDNITAGHFGLKPGEITMVELPISDKPGPQFCLISDSTWREMLFPSDIDLLFSVEMLSRRPELCQQLVTSEQWDTFLAKVPSLVERPQLLTESDLAYVRGIATQALASANPEYPALRCRVHEKIAYLYALLAFKYFLMYYKTCACDEDLAYRLNCIQRLADILHEESLPVSRPTIDEPIINSIQIIEV